MSAKQSNKVKQFIHGYRRARRAQEWTEIELNRHKICTIDALGVKKNISLFKEH